MNETTPVLTEKNSYTTPPGKKSFLARISPSLVYYYTVISVIFNGAGLAKKGRYYGSEWVKSSLRLLRGMERAGAKFTIENLNIFKDIQGPCIFVANHMSTLETFVLPGLIHPFKPATFVIKESLSTMPVFRHLMNARHPIVVGRTNPREDLKTMLREGQRNLAEGISLIIFPQTTRSREFDPASFNSIGVKLAKKAGVPVVPVALKTDAQPNGKIVKDLGRIDPDKPIFFTFGEPLYISGSGREEQKLITDFISGKLSEWQ